MNDTLEERVRQFQMMELPGQSMGMHMGTMYLVNDLWYEIKKLRAELAREKQTRIKYQDLIYKSCYEALTVQALRMRNEVFRMGGMSKEQFTRTYLGGIGEYERKLAEREGIEI